MLDLSERQRSVLIETLPDTANIAAAGLLFGQVVSGRPFSVILAILGFALWVVMLGWSMFLARRHT